MKNLRNNKFFSSTALSLANIIKVKNDIITLKRSCLCHVLLASTCTVVISSEYPLLSFFLFFFSSRATCLWHPVLEADTILKRDIQFYFDIDLKKTIK